MAQILKLRGADAFSTSRLARLRDGARVVLLGLTRLPPNTGISLKSKSCRAKVAVEINLGTRTVL